jgi:hypothetical protein
MIGTAAGTAITGAYANTGYAVGYGPLDDIATDDDTSSYFGDDPQIAINKVTVDGATSGDALSITAGKSIKWRYTVTNVGNCALAGVLVTDSQTGVTPTRISGDTNNNNVLDLTEIWTYEASGTAVAGSYSNTGTASGSHTDAAGHSRTDTETDGSSYFGVDSRIAIQKDTLGADGNWGDGVMVWVGDQVTWRYTVTNPGNVPLSSVTITDNKEGTIAGPDSGDANADGKLDPGETWIYTKASSSGAVLGTYNNIGYAEASYTVNSQTFTAPKVNDPSSYTAVPPALWTDSALTTFDVDGNVAGRQFRAIFTPDPAGPGYKLNATNPGQFYANWFYIRTANTQTINWSITIPYPFVVQGANPMHAYNGATIIGTYPAQTIVPGTPGVAISGLFPTSRLDYLGAATKTITGTFTVPASWSASLVYFNLHLDYGLKDTGGYAKGGSGNDAMDLTGTTLKIADLTPYTFATDQGTNDTIQNENAFKKNPGIGGRGYDKLSLNAKAGLPVVIKDANKRVIGTTVTDNDGWYMLPYKWTGKAATFYVTCGGITKSTTLKANGFVVVNFEL